MSDAMAWVADHLPQLFFGLIALCALLAGLSARWAWRKAKQAPRRWPGLVAPLLALVVSVGGLGLVSFAYLEFGSKVVAQRALVGSPAPPLDYKLVADGSAASLAGYRGQPVLVNLWATWCPPCRAEMPELEKLQAAYRDQGLVVLQISDEPPQTIAEYLSKAPMSTTHGYVAAFPWPAGGWPSTWLIDRDGVIRRTIVGPRSYEQFEREVKRHLLPSS